MRKFFTYIFVLLSASILFNACQHDIITVNGNLSLDPVVVVNPPATTVPAGGIQQFQILFVLIPMFYPYM